MGKQVPHIRGHLLRLGVILCVDTVINHLESPYLFRPLTGIFISVFSRPYISQPMSDVNRTTQDVVFQ